MPEATEYEYKLHVPQMTDLNDISLLCEGNTRGYVEFHRSHDPFH